jgi:hypothetical protein
MVDLLFAVTEVSTIGIVFYDLVKELFQCGNELPQMQGLSFAQEESLAMLNLSVQLSHAAGLQIDPVITPESLFRVL